MQNIKGAMRKVWDVAVGNGRLYERGLRPFRASDDNLTPLYTPLMFSVGLAISGNTEAACVVAAIPVIGLQTASLIKAHMHDKRQPKPQL